MARGTSDLRPHRTHELALKIPTIAAKTAPRGASPAQAGFAGKTALLVPALTPFDADYAPDARRFAVQCARLLEEGAHGLAVFGTTSEAASLSATERISLLDALVSAGIEPAALMPGCGSCSLTEAIQLAGYAAQLGCGGMLVMPPFFYRSASEDGRFAWFAELIERVSSPQLRLYLYHFPQMSGQPITHGVIERLLKRYPDAVAGMKDSAGNWEDTASAIRAFPQLAVFSGSESFLLRNIQAGGSGCISATANVNARAIRGLIDAHASAEAEQLQDDLTAVRAAFEKYPMIPALKAFVAADQGDPEWARLRPPLQVLDDAARAQLLADTAAAGLNAGDAAPSKPHSAAAA